MLSARGKIIVKQVYWIKPYEQTSMKFESNALIFIPENAFDNVICNMLLKHQAISINSAD